VVEEPDPNLAGWFQLGYRKVKLLLQKKKEEKREIFSHVLKRWMFFSWSLEASPEAWTFGSVCHSSNVFGSYL
jgi:hypothetical protein